MISVAALYRYPVKTMLGCGVTRTSVAVAGVTGDRRWALKDVEADDFYLGKRLPELMAWTAQEDNSTLPARPMVTLTSPDGIQISSASTDVDATLSELLKHKVKLCYAPQSLDMGGQTAAAFFDDMPLLIMTTNSLATLSRQAPASNFDIRRFRPNILLDCSSMETDVPERDWPGKQLQVGTATLTITSACPRCRMTTHGFSDLPEDKNILAVLQAEHESCLGVYAKVTKVGDIEVGDQGDWINET